MAGWEFLERWRGALCATLLNEEPRYMEYNLHVTIITPCLPDVDENSVSSHSIVVGVPVDPDGKYRRELQLVREALELFTILFKVNYQIFGQLLSQKLPEDSSKCRLLWDLWPLGVMPQRQKTSPLTWGALLSFPDDPWTYSPLFQSAMQKLQEMSETGECGTMQLRSVCVFRSAQVQGWQPANKSERSSSFQSFQLKGVLDLGVPPVARLCANRGKTTDIDTREQNVVPVDEAVCSASTLCPYVVAKEVLLITPRDFMEIVTALAETSMEKFMLDLADDYEDNVPDTPTMVANGGVLLNAIFRGCLPCTVPG